MLAWLSASARAVRAAAALTAALALAAPAAASVLGRDDEPVVLDGSAVPSLIGAPPSRIVAFRYASGWVQVPAQVDERAVVDFGTIYNSTPMAETVLAYADPGTFTGADSDPSLDADDEIALRAADAGARAPSGAAQPAGTLSGTGVEVTVTNPLDASTGWLYLFESDGTLDPSAGVPSVAYVFDLLSGDYKTTYDTSMGPNPEDSTVTTSAYTAHFSDRWIRDATSILRGGASGADILDRHKNLFAPGDCRRSEQTFSNAEGAFIANRKGPVRAIRAYVGANSGVTTYRVHLFYPAEETILTVLRVHPIPGVMDYFDYAPAAVGMKYLDNLNTAGVTIDGSPDTIVPGTLDWEMVTGAQGTLVHTLLLDTDIPDFATTTYYSDTTSPTTTQCTGDAFEYGASGLWRDGGIPNTDPSLGVASRMNLTRVIRYGPPNETLAYAQQRALEAHNPLEAQAAPWSPGGSVCPDADGDGYAVCSASCTPPGGATCGDCDDTKASVHPGATEVCNGIDDNCNGSVDEGVKSTFHRDADGDGYGDPSVTTSACTAPAGYVADGTDCDDTKASVHPGVTEVCNGIDDNCNGSVDEGVKSTFHRDADGDGYGDPAVTTSACTAPAGYVVDGTDCDDTKASVHPGATEVCNGIDDNCNGSVDEGVKSTFHRDADGDGYGDPSVTTSACTAPAGYVADGTDCDDTKASVHPGVTEVCNGIDDNCNGSVDEGVKSTFHRDADGDGYGDPAVTTSACTAPAGYVVDGTDCDDTKASVHPGATEVCGNGIDDDCDGLVDAADPECAPPTCPDADGDGYAACSASCTPPAGATCGDCDDTKASVHPGATEVCNGIDDNCNGTVDEGVKSTFHRDADGDGYGDPGTTSTACAAPAGYVVDGTDCDDTKASVHPGATEACNGIDDNCNGTVDEGVKSTFHRDADGDGYGDPSVTTSACTAPAGYVVDGTDCDDTKASVHPGATEVCGNGIDDNCDGHADATDPACALPACPDADGDGYAVCSASCMVTGATVCGDCDDGNAAVHPGAAEVCGNGIDDDCDGYDLGCGPEVCPDADGDHFEVCGPSCVLAPGDSCGDCDDTDPARHPGAAETCNGVDDNCNGSVDEGVAPSFHRDADGDGYGDPATATSACTAPAGYVVDGTDCDDADPQAFPGAPDLCGDGIDEDCDGTVDVSPCERFDVNGDGRVDGLDLAILGRAFGSCSPDPASTYWDAADYTRDGCVSGDDLALLGAAWACVSGEDLCRR